MSKWRERYKVHPAADVFRIMSDEELLELGEDIKANGLQSPIICQDGPGLILLDGRNRLEAMELIGLDVGQVDTIFVKGNPVSAIISANVHRRHLTKEQRAQMLVAEQFASVGEMPPRHVKGKAGSAPEPVKAAAVAKAKEHGISKRTVERAFEKKKREEEPHDLASDHPNAPPRLRAKARRQKKRATMQEYSQQLARLPKNLAGARWYYLQFVAKPGVDLSAEMTLIVDAIQNIVDRETVNA